MSEPVGLFDLAPTEPVRKERAPMDQRCGSYPYTRADGVPEAQPLFQAAGGGSIPTSALQLKFERLDFHTARQLNQLWHSRLPILHTGAGGGGVYLVCYAAEFEGGWYAVAVWSSPASLHWFNVDDKESLVELRRFAIGAHAPKNTASRMLGFMVRDLFRAYPRLRRCISYQDTGVHSGTIYKAAGWHAAARRNQPPEWNTRMGGTNYRTGRAAVPAPTPKVRWEIHR